MLTQIQLAELLLWGPCILNVLGIRSQIIHNYELRSTHGISHLMLWLFHFGSLSLCTYVYLIDLPFALKVMLPVEVIMVTILVAQEMWYAPTLLFRAQILAFHGGLISFSGLMWIVGSYYPLFIGNVAGWAAAIALAGVQLPQIIRTWKRKSTHGFSPGILVYGTLSPLLTLWCCYELRLPLQTWTNTFRTLFYRVVQWWQFAVYRRDKH